MKFKMNILLVILSLLVLVGCASEKSASPVYGCLPSGEEAAWETVMGAAISAVADAAGREDEPLDFMNRYKKSPRGGGTWVITLIYAGGDVYNINLDSSNAGVRTIVKLPASYLDALNAFSQAGTKASQGAELIYSREG